MSFENWVATAGEKEWIDKMGIKIRQNAQEKEPAAAETIMQKGESKE